MSQDTLSQVLRSIRLRGAVFYHVEGNDRWVSEAPPARAIAALIMPGIEHVMAYHVLTQGTCWSMVDGQAPVRLHERLSETMFVALVRRYLHDLPEGPPTWLAGLNDRYIGRALALLHARPAEAWTIDRLADHVGLSRSSLHERFARFTGLAPMHYLAKWRMQVAAGLLRQSSAPVASIALEVGYESESAFSRAFRREVGQPPAAWRRQRSRLGAGAA